MSELRIIEPTRETLELSKPGRVEFDLPCDTVRLVQSDMTPGRYGGSYHVYVSGQGDTAEAAARAAMAELLRTLRLAVAELEALAPQHLDDQVAEAAAEAIHETVPPLPSIVTWADALGMAKKKIAELETERDEHWAKKGESDD